VKWLRGILTLKFELGASTIVRLSFGHIFQNFHRIFTAVAFNFLPKSFLIKVAMFRGVVSQFGCLIAALIIILNGFDVGLVGKPSSSSSSAVPFVVALPVVF